MNRTKKILFLSFIAFTVFLLFSSSARAMGDFCVKKCSGKQCGDGTCNATYENSTNCSADCGLACVDSGETCSADEDCCSGYCYVDADGDRYKPYSGGTKTCHADTPLGDRDCCDSDSRAYPGQTRYYGTAATNCGYNNFDFNCDGSQEKNERSCSHVTGCAITGSDTVCCAGCSSVEVKGSTNALDCGNHNPSRKMCYLYLYSNTACVSTVSYSSSWLYSPGTYQPSFEYYGIKSATVKATSGTNCLCR